MSKLEVRYLSEPEYSDWNALVDSSPYGTVFHKSTWSKALFSHDNSVTTDIIGCFNKGNSLIAGSVISWKKVFKKLKVGVVPYATPFYGIVISDRKSEYLSKRERQRFAVLEALLKFIEKNYDSIIMSFPPEFNDIRVFNWRKYATRVLYTYRGEIRNPGEEIFSSNILRRIKKAENLEYRITRNKEREHILAVFQMITKSYKRQRHQFGLMPEHFVSLFTNEQIGEQFEVFSIWHDDAPVASILILIDKETAYYWLAGGDHSFFDTGLNQLLLTKIFGMLSQSGVKQFDFAGANTQSIANYKSGYNLDLVPYYFVSKKTSRRASFLFLMKDFTGVFSMK